MHSIRAAWALHCKQLHKGKHLWCGLQAGSEARARTSSRLARSRCAPSVATTWPACGHTPNGSCSKAVLVLARPLDSTPTASSLVRRRPPAGALGALCWQAALAKAAADVDASANSARPRQGVACSTSSRPQTFMLTGVLFVAGHHLPLIAGLGATAGVRRATAGRMRVTAAGRRAWGRVMFTAVGQRAWDRLAKAALAGVRCAPAGGLAAAGVRLDVPAAAPRFVTSASAAALRAQGTAHAVSNLPGLVASSKGAARASAVKVSRAHGAL